MVTPGVHTYEEITSQPKAWRQALEVTAALRGAITGLWAEHPEKQVLFTGCGSTYYLSLGAAALVQEVTGRGARGVPAGELFLYPAATYERERSHLLVAISRSGTTSETLAAVKRFQETGGGPVAVVTNYGESPLAKLGDLTIAIPAGQEKSVAQTRSFASMVVALAGFTVLAAGREDLLQAMVGLPEIGSKLIETSQPVAKSLGKKLDLDRFYFLGSGPRYGLACEVNLKMKEMSLTHSEPFHFMEFRHGPMSMVTPSSAVIGLLSDAQNQHEQAVLDHMMALGGNVFSLAESGADLNFSSGLPEAVRNVLYLPPLQLMAYYRAVEKGLDPDNPENLSAVIELDLM
jgi:glucosamine--fructose-6-phosphate aminotransferase (isomerizing)